MADQDVLSLLLLQSSSSSSSPPHDAPSFVLRLSPSVSYTSLLLLLLRPPGLYVRLGVIVVGGTGFAAVEVSVLSVPMMSVLVLLEGQRELKGGSCGEYNH